MISDSDAKHLECVERASFQPIGWLYQGIFERLLERGLVAITVSDAYIISDYGAAQLEAFRLEGLRRLAEHNVEKSMSNRTIADLCKRSHEMSRSKGWYDGEEKDPRPIKLATLLMQSELIEALEEYRSNKLLPEIYFTMSGHTFSADERDRSVEPPGNDPAYWKPEGILVELADCIIRIAQRCGSDETDMQSLVDLMHSVTVEHGGAFTNDFETMLATCMADISVSYLTTTPGGKQMLEARCMPTTPEYYWATVWASIFSFCEQHKLDLWSAIELKEAFNATRPMRHGGKKC